MVLVSHKHKFIYLKTRKTASTSVEAFFEKFCQPDPDYQPCHTAHETISEYGIIGKRFHGVGLEWKPHMKANQVRDKVGEKIWNSYFKFCVIRNPWDKIVSRYFWKNRKESPLPDFKEWLMDLAREHEKAIHPVEKQGNPIDGNIYTIDGNFIADYYIRFEQLQQGIQNVCQRLKLDFDVNQLNNYKSQIRKQGEVYTVYYDDDTRKIVSDMFAKEIEYFSYKFGE